MRQEEVNEIVRMVLSREHIFPFAFGIGFIGLMALVGYFSCRFLRSLPDFEHKAEMLWGAKWGWALILAAPAIGMLITYVGMIFTIYTTTSILAGFFVFWVVLALDLLLLPYQSMGQLAVVDLTSARSKRQSFDLDSWLEHERQTRPKRRRMRYVVVMAWILMWGGTCGYLAVTSSYPLDWEMAELYRVLPLAETLTQQLASPLVKGVFPNPPFRQQPYELRVKVPEDTTTVQAEEVLRQTQQALARLGEPRRWEIVVTDCGKKTFATGLYDPRSPSR